MQNDWEPDTNPRSSTTQDAPESEVLKKKRNLPSHDELRPASPGVNPGYPVSVRQQLALIKQMEQPASADGETPGGNGTGKRRIPRAHKKNDRGETPLHVAAKKGDDSACLRLLNEGADVNSADYAGWTALHEACSHQRLNTALILLEHGANVNSCSVDGDTPLHDAAASNSNQLVWLLLKHGADRDGRNKDGKRAIDCCAKESDVYNLLAANFLADECPAMSVGFEIQDSRPQSAFENAVAEQGGSNDSTASMWTTTSAVEEKSGEIRATTSSARDLSAKSVDANLVAGEDAAYDKVIKEEAIDSAFDDVPRTSEQDAIDGDEDMRDTRRMRGNLRGRGRGMAKFVPTNMQIAKGKAGRGRGRRGRAGTVSSRGLLRDEANPDDVYEFKSSPESDEQQTMNIAREDEEDGGTAKREEDVDDFIVSADMDDLDDECSRSKKVPPLTLRIAPRAKTPTEEDQDEANARKRGRPGKRTLAVDADEAQRITRSRVKQGRTLDDVDAAAKKKRVRLVDADEAAESVIEGPTATEAVATIAQAEVVVAVPIVQLSPTQQILRLNPNESVFLMKKMMAKRWMDEAICDTVKQKEFNSNPPELHLFTGQYKSCIECPINDSVVPEAVCIEFADLWKRQESERTVMRRSNDIEKVRTRLCFEQEFVRLQRRRTDTNTRMSLARILREDVISNPTIVEDVAPMPKAIEHSEFVERLEKRVETLFRRQRLEASTLQCSQVDQWREQLARKTNSALSQDVIVPLVNVEKLDLHFDSIQVAQ